MREYRLFSAEEVKQVLEWRDEGLTFTEIGNRLGRTRNSIAGCLFRAAKGVESERAEKMWARRAGYQEAVAAGLTVREIAARYNVAEITVYDNLRRYGLRPNRPRRSA